MTDVALAVGVLALAGVIGWLVKLARDQRISNSAVRVLALLCGLGLIAMLLTDWPSEVLAKFWADHSVVAGILSTVLLVGVVFLMFEDSERREQALLDSSVTAAGLGGIVDHAVEVEVALALVSSPQDPGAHGWQNWAEPSRPLRWLRTHREWLARAEDGGPGERDPRRLPVNLSYDSPAKWRLELLDQCVRRLLAAIRDWSPVIRGSRNGVMILIAISEIRKDLMAVSVLIDENDISAADRLLVLRQRLRLLAHFLETTSGARPLRPEVLTSLEPLPSWREALEWAADSHGRKTFGPEWRERLRATQKELTSGR